MVSTEDVNEGLEVTSPEQDSNEPSSSSATQANKGDEEVQSGSTTASDQKDTSSSPTQEAADVFKFSSAAAEFVPKASSSFQFNPSAQEFQPGPVSDTMPENIAQTPQSSITLVPLAMPGLGVYPVMAVQVPTGVRPVTYVSPAGVVANPVGHLTVAGFAPAISHIAMEDRSKGYGKGARSHDLAHGRPAQAHSGNSGRSYQDQRQDQWTDHSERWSDRRGRQAYGSQQYQKSGRWQDNAESNGYQKEEQEKPPAEQAETKEEVAEEEKEETKDDDKEPKKPSWADLVRKKVETNTTQVPNKKASVVTPPGPSTAVPKAVNWGPKAQEATSSDVGEEAVAPTSRSDVQQTHQETVQDKLQKRHVPTEVVTEAADEPQTATQVDEISTKEGADKEVEKEEESTNGDDKKETTSWAARLFKNQPTSPARPKAQGPIPKVAVPKTPSQGAWSKASSVPSSVSKNTKEDSWDSVEQEKVDKTKASQVPVEDVPTEEAESEEVRDETHEAEAEEVLVDAEEVEAEEGDEEAEEEEEEDDEEADEQEVEEEDDAAGEEDKEEGDEEEVEDANEEHESFRQTLEFGKPNASGVIRYSVTFLKMMSKAPQCEGSCPSSIPHGIRTGAEEKKPKQRYGLKFLEQFKEKSGCQDLPVNHRIPKELRGDIGDAGKALTKESKDSRKDGDDWRQQAAKSQKSKDLKGGRSGRAGRTIERKTEDALKLESSETSWAKVQQGAKKDDDAAVVRQIKSILNKLTVEKFETLYQQLLECGIQSETHAEVLMEEVFEKATLQHHFIEMYTSLCIRLSHWFSERDITDSNGKTVSFKKILINQCQDSFERYLRVPEGLQDLSGEEQFEAKVKYKTKMLGNAKFVGQLLNNKAISSKVIFKCCWDLIETATEETLETLCAFVTTLGPEFDKKDWKGYMVLNDIYLKVAALSADSKIPSRIRCLLKDVTELRANDWKGQRPTKEPQGPKRIADVKEQWAKDNAQQDRGAAASGGRSGTQVRRDEDEWETVGPSNRRGANVPTVDRREKPKEPAWRKVKSPTSGTSAEVLKPTTPSARQAVNPTLVPQGKSLIELTAQAQTLAPAGMSLSTSSAAVAASEDKKAENFKKEVSNIIRELSSSFDVDGAIARIRESTIHQRHQKDAIARVMSLIVESTPSARPCLWGFLAKLFAEGIFQKSLLVDGLSGWFSSETFEDLKVDVPRLEHIIEEWLEVAQSKGGLITPSDVERLKEQLESS